MTAVWESDGLCNHSFLKQPLSYSSFFFSKLAKFCLFQRSISTRSGWQWARQLSCSRQRWPGRPPPARYDPKPPARPPPPTLSTPPAPGPVSAPRLTQRDSPAALPSLPHLHAGDCAGSLQLHLIHYCSWVLARQAPPTAVFQAGLPPLLESPSWLRYNEF